MIRVFPRKTNASPNDDEAFYGPPPVRTDHNLKALVSCSFTYDKPEAERLAELWSRAGYNVSIGGPAYNAKGGGFISGKFLKKGVTITSRGCNNRCWFCYVPRREGQISELKIKDGWNVMDSNLLQCSEEHVKAVFAMLKRQPKRAVFTGGLDTKELEDWHVHELRMLYPERMYLAYDTKDDWVPLVCAASKLQKAGFRYNHVSCFVLIGYPNDTMIKAEERLNAVVRLGVMPFAMLWRNEKGETKREWRQFQRHWAAPVAVGAKMKKAGW